MLFFENICRKVCYKNNFLEICLLKKYVVNYIFLT